MSPAKRMLISLTYGPAKKKKKKAAPTCLEGFSLSFVYNQPDPSQEWEFSVKNMILKLSDRNGGRKRGVSRPRVLIGYSWCVTQISAIH